MGRLEPTELRALRAEAAKRFGLLTPKDVILAPSARDTERQHVFLRSLFQQQRDFASDPARLKAALCGRRSGKTTTLLFMALRAAREYAGSTIPYICLDREMAKRLFWRPLKVLNDRWHFNIKFNETNLLATAPNGSTIWLLGAKDEDDIEKMRGDKYPCVFIDECASFKSHIQQLVEDVVGPALEDLNGTLCLVGTPGRIPAGMFYEVTNGLRPGWSVHKWTVLQNAMFARWRGHEHWEQEALDWLCDLRRSNGWEESDPVYRREWLGEWVEDRDVLVYRFHRAKNTYKELPEGDWLHVLGVDFGYSPDPTAFSVGAFSPTRTEYYVVETFEQTEMIAEDVAGKVRELEAKYGTFLRKVGDASSKQFFMELNQRKGLNIVTAEKQGKLDFIEHMNSDFRQGRIKVKESDPLCEQYLRLVWNADRTAEHASRANHAADATLYAWRESRHWAGRVPVTGPEAGSAESIDRGMAAYLARAAEEEAQAAENREDTGSWQDYLWTANL